MNDTNIHSNSSHNQNIFIQNRDPTQTLFMTMDGDQLST